MILKLYSIPQIVVEITETHFLFFFIKILEVLGISNGTEKLPNSTTLFRKIYWGFKLPRPSLVEGREKRKMAEKQTDIT